MMLRLKNKIAVLGLLICISYQPVTLCSLATFFHQRLSYLLDPFRTPRLNQIRKFMVPVLKTGSVTGVIYLAGILTPYGQIVTAITIGFLYGNDSLKNIMSGILEQQDTLITQQKETDDRVQEVQVRVWQQGVQLTNVIVSQNTYEQQRKKDHAESMHNQQELQQTQCKIVAVQAKQQKSLDEIRGTQEVHGQHISQINQNLNEHRTTYAEDMQHQTKISNQLLNQCQDIDNQNKTLLHLMEKNNEEKARKEEELKQVLDGGLTAVRSEITEGLNAVRKEIVDLSDATARKVVKALQQPDANLAVNSRGTRVNGVYVPSSKKTRNPYSPMKIAGIGDQEASPDKN